jgi:hypothetical protein
MCCERGTDGTSKFQECLNIGLARFFPEPKTCKVVESE